MVPIGGVGPGWHGLGNFVWKARARPSPAQQTLAVIPEAWNYGRPEFYFFYFLFFANVLQYLGEPQLLTRSSSLIATVTVEPFWQIQAACDRTTLSLPLCSYGGHQRQTSIISFPCPCYLRLQQIDTSALSRRYNQVANWFAGLTICFLSLSLQHRTETRYLHNSMHDSNNFQTT